MVVSNIHRSGIFHGARKKTFWGQKGENKPSEPKNGIWGPKSVWSCDISIGNFTWSKKNILLGVKKAKISLQSPKAELRSQKIKNKIPR
jgi:hypothetical protein